ncbi:MAG: 2,3-diphosphoglycerate-dependent phosphoglycerate mutase, partial [Pseudomonadota bacterium]
GWIDVDLSEKGMEEARNAGRLLHQEGLQFNLAFTSVLKRAIRTLWIALEVMDQMWIPEIKSWRLNERHYGALQGLNKAETAQRHGEEQVHLWRRSFDVPPPPLSRDDPRPPHFDPRYQEVEPDFLPDGESLKATLVRVLPYWENDMAPRLKQGLEVVCSAHGNSIRALAKHLFNISDQDIPSLEIPTGNPLLIELDAGLKVKSCRYLDETKAGPLPAV